MKKILAIFLAMLLALSCAAMADEPKTDGEAQSAQETAQHDLLVVGSTTALSGCFFTEMWGNNTSDIDVRKLLHGYNLMEWQGATGAYGLNTSVASVAVSEDYLGNRTYTVALYDDLYYSDGTQITARDYIFCILLSVAPEIAAIGGRTTDSEFIMGMDEYRSGAAETLAGVRLLEDFILSITVKAEYLPFFYELALLNYNPYPIHVIAPGCEIADDGEGAYIRNIAEQEQPIFTADLLRETILNPETGYLSHPSVVSGPYRLVSFDWETRVAEFEINEYYKGNFAGQKPVISRLEFRSVNPDTMVAELASGEVNLLHKCVNADVIDAGMALISEGGFSTANYPRSGYSFISFCCEQPTVGGVNVRQAIASCLDKKTLVTDYVQNYGVAVDGYYGIGQWIYQLVTGTLGSPVAELGENPTDEETAAHEAEQAAWDELTLDNVATYPLNVNHAVDLLVQDGWTLNSQGEDFNPEQDNLRCKEIDGRLVALELTMIVPEGNAIAQSLDAIFVPKLAQAGISLTIEPMAMTDLLDVYYRKVERECDMIYLATNFATVFDPSETYNPGDAYQGTANRSAIMDEELYNRAVDLRRTEPGDVLTYCQKWVAFQERWAEVLPAIPIYSNVYFDFYTDTLHDYSVSANQTWSEAIIGAYQGDAMADATEGEDEELEEGEIIIGE